MPNSPYPVPTPWQPKELGGNANVPKGLIGPSIPAGFIGPIQAPRGATYMTNANSSPSMPSQAKTSQPTQPSPPPSNNNGDNNISDAQYDALGVARGDIGGYHRVLQEQQANRNNANQEAADREKYLGEVDSAFNDVFKLFNTMESDTKAGEQNFYNSYTKPYEAQRPLLDQAYKEGTQLNTSQMDQNKQDEASVLSDARRMFNELNQGVRQRFGGSNSAGKFANEFYGREFARQAGNIQNTAGQNMKALKEKAVQLKEKYDAQLQSLVSQKEAALSQAKDIFRQRLDAINNAKAGAIQNKADAKLNALKELRAEQVNIDNFTKQKQASLDQMTVQANLNLRNDILAYKMNAGQTPSLGEYISPQAPTLQGGQSYLSPQISGYYDPNKKDRYSIN